MYLESGNQYNRILFVYAKILEKSRIRYFADYEMMVAVILRLLP